MAAIDYFLANATSDGWRRLATTAQAAATINDGWVVSTASGNHSEYAVGVERAASTFTGTTVPDGTLDTSLKDAFRSESALSGFFDSANWVFSFVVRAVTVGGAQDGRIRFRIIKADADGSNATEITSGQQQASIVTDVGTGADATSSLTVNPGAFSLNNQYLFIQIAWERTGAGGMTTSDINWRTGSSTSAGTRIATANFTAHIAKTPSDTSSVSLTETSTNDVSSSPSDTASATVSETSTNDVASSVSDTAAASVSESVAVEASMTVSDTAGLTLTETVTVTVVIDVADTSAVSVSESVTTEVLLSVTDTASASVTESAAVQSARSVTDTAGVSLSELYGDPITWENLNEATAPGAGGIYQDIGATDLGSGDSVQTLTGDGSFEFVVPGRTTLYIGIKPV